MPYIKRESRKEFDNNRVSYLVRIPSHAGELNYALTLLCKEYLENKKKSYQTINDIIGALEGAKMEFYRRIVVPYEDTKILDNGDVY